MYKIKIRKVRSTWHWFVINPEGGGFGSNQVSTRASVLCRALSGIPDGATCQLYQDDKLVEEFVKGAELVPA